MNHICVKQQVPIRKVRIIVGIFQDGLELLLHDLQIHLIITILVRLLQVILRFMLYEDTEQNETEIIFLI